MPAVRVSHADPWHARVVLVDWMLGNACNHACSYCPAELHDGTIRWQDTKVVVELFDRLRAHYVERLGRHVWIQFTGGEPTMHPRIVELLDESAARGFSASLISNGSRTPRFWLKVRPHLKSVILTYHAEFVQHDHFMVIARMMAEEMPVHINVTMIPERFDQILERAREILAEVPRASLSLKPLREDFRDVLYPYSPDQLDAMEKGLRSTDRHDGTTPRGVMNLTWADGSREAVRANAIIVKGTNRWRGYLCNAGLESLRVKANGQVTRAVCASGGVLGRLGGSVVLPEGPIVCERDTCGCVADILVSKVALKRGEV